jgi:hypothetical protein
MMMTATTTTTMEEGNVPRYQRLLAVLQLALSQSQKTIDIAEAIRNVYGDDDQNNNAVFQELLRTVLENANTQVSIDMKQYFVENHTQQILDKLEAVMIKLDGDAHSQQRAAEQDQRSTERAFNMAFLQPSSDSSSFTAQEMITIRKYQTWKREKIDLESKRKALEQEIETLQSMQQEYTQDTQSTLDEIHNHVVKVIESSADLGSMVA